MFEDGEFEAGVTWIATRRTLWLYVQERRALLAVEKDGDFKMVWHWDLPGLVRVRWRCYATWYPWRWCGDLEAKGHPEVKRP